eukprot:1157399-Rhodomonas_salina.1
MMQSENGMLKSVEQGGEGYLLIVVEQLAPRNLLRPDSGIALTSEASVSAVAHERGPESGKGKNDVEPARALRRDLLPLLQAQLLPPRLRLSTSTPTRDIAVLVQGMWQEQNRTQGD